MTHAARSHSRARSELKVTVNLSRRPIRLRSPGGSGGLDRVLGDLRASGRGVAQQGDSRPEGARLQQLESGHLEPVGE